MLLGKEFLQYFIAAPDFDEQYYKNVFSVTYFLLNLTSFSLVEIASHQIKMLLFQA